MMTGMRIVYVEDDPAQERLVREIVQREGGTLEAVGSTGEARAVLTERPPDAALVDLRLPDGSGLDLIREFRAQGSDLPLVVVTASEAPEDAVAALKAGAEEYLVKPIVPALLLEAVRRAAADVRRRRELSRLWGEIARSACLPEAARDSARLRKLLRQAADVWNLEGSGAVEPDPLPEGLNLLETVDRLERRMIRDALERSGWVKARAARALGVTERILSYKMQNLGIERPSAGQSCGVPTKTSGLSSP